MLMMAGSPAEVVAAEKLRAEVATPGWLADSERMTPCRSCSETEFIIDAGYTYG